MARERKIPYYYDFSIHELRIRLGLKKPIVKLQTKSYSKGELKTMARSKGLKGFSMMKKHELAEMLDIELSKPKPKQKARIARSVEILNSARTKMTYPSISKAAQALGKHTVQLYVMAAKGNAQIL